MPTFGNNEDNNTNENNTDQTQQEKMRELSNILAFMNSTEVYSMRENPRAERRQEVQAAPDREARAAQNQGNARQDKPKSLWGTIKHGLFTGLAALSAATVGGFFWLVSYPFTRTDKYKQRLHGKDEVNDTDIIPGTKNKEKFYTPDVDGGRDDQDVLDDNRRIPLVFEREIFEDVNAAPTVTFNFQQGREGDTSSFTSALPSAFRNGLKVGHASITMKYTRKDPLTGQPKRYQTSFGFAANVPPSVANGIAQQVTDTYVPGVMTDDFNNPMTIGKEYTINNKTINKLILKAQSFEKGGYQVIKRNCAAFAAEMAETAGIPEEERNKIFQKTDFKIDPGIVAGVGGVAAFIAAPALVRIGKAQAMSLAGQVNPSWGRFGQSWLPMEDANRIENTEFNTRLYGYAPSQGGEALRQIRGVGLHSDSYGNDILSKKVKKKGNEKPTAEENMRLRFDKIVKRFNKEINSLTKTLHSHFKNDPVNKDVITLLRNFSALYSYETGTSGDMFTANTLREKRNACKELCANIDRFCNEGLNRKYLDHYEGADAVDPKVNIAFQHVASLFSNMKSLVMQQDQILRGNLYYYGYNNLPESPDADYGEFIDMSRDSADFLKPFVFQYTKMEKDPVGLSCAGLSEVGAGLLTFGDLNTFFKYKELLGKENLTRQEKKLFNKLNLRGGTLQNFKNVQLNYAGGRHFDKSDYKLAMVDLPEAIKTSGIKFTGASRDAGSPEKAYQMIALERIFGGMKKAIYDEVKRQGATLDSVKSVISNHIATKMRENRAEYNLLAGVCIDECVRQARSKEVAPSELENYKEGILEKTNDMIMHALKFSYLNPLLERLESACYKDPTLNVNKIKVGELTKLKLESSEFSEVHRETHKQLGIQPVLHAKHLKLVARINNMAADDKSLPKESKEDVVKEFLSLGACYQILMEEKKAPSFDGDVIMDEMVNQIKTRITVEDKNLDTLFKKARRCTKDFPLAMSGEEKDLLKEMRSKSKEFKDLMKEIKDTGFKLKDKPAEKNVDHVVGA